MHISSLPGDEYSLCFICKQCCYLNDLKHLTIRTLPAGATGRILPNEAGTVVYFRTHELTPFFVGGSFAQSIVF